MDKIKNLSLEEIKDFYIQEALRLKSKEKELEDVKTVLISKMKEEKLEEVGNELATFSQASRTTYSYPAEVLKIKEQLAEAEEKSKNDGTAEAKVTVFYQLRAKKLKI